MDIKIYDTLSGQKEPLQRRKDGPLTMYTCGPTVYDSTHLGHLIPPVIGDVVKRYLQSKGQPVKWVHNFTDVEDKIIQRAAEEGVASEDIAERYIEEYLQVLAAFGVDTVDVFPRVSEHMDDIIAMIADLIEKGAAYAANGDVYFSVASFPEYGKLSRRNVEELQAGARVEADPKKQAPADFALWKAAKPGEPSWPSPWGPGRPGWHIECSAMSMKHLGYPIDIHGGGIDLVFPHHENEIAQSEAHQGHGPFVRHWLHTGLLQQGDEKMSKSLGNFERAKDLLDQYGPMVLRLFILSHHYRNPRDYNVQRLEEARRAWRRLDNTVTNLKAALAAAGGPPADAGGEADEPAREALHQLTAALQRAEADFDRAMGDDFNTAQAIAGLFDLARYVNSVLRHQAALPAGQAEPLLQQALTFFESKGELLGILNLTPRAEADGQGELVEDLLDLLLTIRQEAREQRDWALSDRIRDGLAQLGVQVEDTTAGPRVRREQSV